MKRKRFISIAAALCLALTAAPMGVLAQEEGGQVLLEEIKEEPQEEIQEEIKEEPVEEIQEEIKEEPQEEIQEEIEEEPQEKISAFSLEENGIAVQAENADFEGAGTEASPYLIKTADDLKLLAAKVNGGESYSGKYFEQTADIDLSGIDNWTPIGTYDNNGTGKSKPFEGSYNGSGKQITNLKITNGNFIGLFGYIYNNATIQNCNVEGEIKGVKSAGGIVGCLHYHTTIENCSFRGTIECTEAFAGGIVGQTGTNSTIKNCYVIGSVKGVQTVGGIVGLLLSDTIENCYVLADVTATERNAGGIAGSVSGETTKIKNCYHSGTVSGESWGGGIVGFLRSGTIQNCVALAESVRGSEDVNRIVGYKYNGTIENCYAWSGMEVNGNPASDATDLTYKADGTLSTQFSSIFGENNSAWDFADNKLPTLKDVGGTQSADLPTYIKGFDGEGTAEKPYQIKTADDLKLLAKKVNGGESYSGKYFKQTADIDLSGIDNWTPIGTAGNSFEGKYDGGGYKITKLKITSGKDVGLFGYINGANYDYKNNVFIENGATIKNCNVTGNVTGDVTGNASSYAYVGGIVGSASHTSITNCSFEGKIEGKCNGSVGGIAGNVIGGSIQNCYALADVTVAGGNAGGIAGNVSGVDTGTTEIKNCYYSGTVSGGSYVGGIVGLISGGGSITIKNCVSLAKSVSGSNDVNRIAGLSASANLQDNYAYNRTKVVTGTGENQTVTYPTGGAVNNANGKDVYISKGKVMHDVASSENFWTALGFTGDNGWTVPNEPYALPYLWEGNNPMLKNIPSVDLTIDETPQHFTTRNIGDGFVVTVTNENITMSDSVPFTKAYRLHGTDDDWATTVPNTAGTYDVRITRAADGNINPFVCEIDGGLILTRKRSSSSSDDTTPSYTVQFDSNGGSAVDKIKTDANGKIEKPADPVKEGYLFAGWYSDSKLTKKFDFSTKPTANLTLYAKWSENNEIVLTIGSRTISVFGSETEYDVAPKIVNDRTMLPIRIVAESLGATVAWNGAQQRVTIQKGEDVILIVIGADTAYINGEAVQLDAAAFIENGRTYLPLRFVSENLGARVLWNEADKTVTILKEIK